MIEHPDFFSNVIEFPRGPKSSVIPDEFGEDLIFSAIKKTAKMYDKQVEYDRPIGVIVSYFYWELEMSDREVGRKLGVSRSTARAWRVMHGIKSRPRGRVAISTTASQDSKLIQIRPSSPSVVK